MHRYGNREKTIKNVFTVGNNEQKEVIKTQIRNMVEGVLCDIGEQGRLDTIFVLNVEKLAKYTYFRNAVTQLVIGNMCFITPGAPSFKKHLERISKEIMFEMALEQQLAKQGMMQISLPHLELNVTKMRSWHHNTTWTTRMEWVEWEKGEKTLKERQQRKSQSCVTWQDLLSSKKSQAAQKGKGSSHFIVRIYEELEGFTQD